ncbi:MAG: hypothetical protein SFW36_01025 [Leptolyngbyaceae cyanobacterium bins.59]|nr:hypothetical protein [Leptolyngbyaceae cyanobacterium bins.59]
MTPDPKLMKAVESLQYRVTVGDVATQAGLDVNLAQRGLLTLASEAGGHLQVAESGEVVYQFPEDFRSVLFRKSLRLRLKALWESIWKVLFYLIRISFGILLIASILLILLTIVIIVTAASSSRGEDDRSDNSGGGGGVFMPNFWFSPDFFWIFYPDYSDRQYERRRRHAYSSNEPRMNFLEAVFSFIFGDGNPNADLEERRWRTIGAVIRNQKGAITAEQIAPYLDTLGEGYTQEYEEFMLPVLSRFNGVPQVSPEGEIVYHFPELQTTVAEQGARSTPAYLEEKPWRFSHAGSGQIILAASLGAVNLVGALVLGSLLADGTVAAELGGLVAFVQSVYGVLLAYGIGFLGIPLLRYFWVQWRNRRVESRNDARKMRSLRLIEPDEPLQLKLAYARQFAAETLIRNEDLVYTTETDLLEQEVNQTDRIDAEWQKRLNESNF